MIPSGGRPARSALVSCRQNVASTLRPSRREQTPSYRRNAVLMPRIGARSTNHEGQAAGACDDCARRRCRSLARPVYRYPVDARHRGGHRGEGAGGGGRRGGGAASAVAGDFGAGRRGRSARDDPGGGSRMATRSGGSRRSGSRRPEAGVSRKRVDGRRPPFVVSSPRGERPPVNLRRPVGPPLLFRRTLRSRVPSPV